LTFENRKHPFIRGTEGVYSSRLWTKIFFAGSMNVDIFLAYTLVKSAINI
jgi:hypothetical protein